MIKYRGKYITERPVTMRLFGGRLFYYASSRKTKTEAKQEADFHRQRGHLVRVVHVRGEYEIYRREKSDRRRP